MDSHTQFVRLLKIVYNNLPFGEEVLIDTGRGEMFLVYGTNNVPIVVHFSGSENPPTNSSDDLQSDQNKQ